MWSWGSASCKGVAHTREASRKQDAVRSFALPNPIDGFALVICDGAGSSPKGGEGASLACLSFTRAIKRYFAVHEALPARPHFEAWMDDARDLIATVASRHQLEMKDYATTLVVAIASPAGLVTAQVGDGAIVVRDAETSSWNCPSWPQQGEYASTTFFITSDSEPDLQVSQLDHRVSAIVAFSDGLERLALNFFDRKPYPRFFDAMVRPFDQLNGCGRSIELSERLWAFLSSEKVCARTEDDKTLVIAVQ